MRRRTAELKTDLHRLMIQRGYYTITEFAEEVGISRSAMSEIVNGKSGASRAVRNVIARKLNTTPDRIWKHL